MKTTLEDLAIMGGSPAFSEQLHVGRPSLGDRQALFKRINDILDRKWLSNGGVYVHEFEKHLADKIGVKHCIATCNGTLALEVAIKAMGLSGEVIIPSFTFIATAHALQWQGITPVFGDIDPVSYNLNPDEVERLITPRTTGIIGVHLFGRPCDIDRLTEIARNQRLKIMFDAAQAFACSYKGTMIGGFGDAEAFSFHATKFFNTFEGGAIATNDDKLADEIRRVKNFGFSGYDNVTSVGTNAKMSEVSAAMGLTNLESLDRFIDANRKNFHYYKEQLDDIPGIQLMPYDDSEKGNYQYVVLEIDEQKTIIDRDQLVGILHAENVLARRYFFPGCHNTDPYRTSTPGAASRLTETDRVSKSLIALPTGTAIEAQQIESICEIIRLAITHGKLIQNRLKESQPVYINAKR